MDLLLEVIFALEYEVQLSEKLLIAWNDFFVQVESCHKQDKLDMTALGQMRSLVLEAEGMSHLHLQSYLHIYRGLMSEKAFNIAMTSRDAIRDCSCDVEVARWEAEKAGNMGGSVAKELSSAYSRAYNQLQEMKMLHWTATLESYRSVSAAILREIDKQQKHALRPLAQAEQHAPPLGRLKPVTIPRGQHAMKFLVHILRRGADMAWSSHLRAGEAEKRAVDIIDERVMITQERRASGGGGGGKEAGEEGEVRFYRKSLNDADSDDLLALPKPWRSLRYLRMSALRRRSLRATLAVTLWSVMTETDDQKRNKILSEAMAAYVAGLRIPLAGIAEIQRVERRPASSSLRARQERARQVGALGVQPKSIIPLPLPLPPHQDAHQWDEQGDSESGSGSWGSSPASSPHARNSPEGSPRSLTKAQRRKAELAAAAAGHAGVEELSYPEESILLTKHVSEMWPIAMKALQLYIAHDGVYLQKGTGKYMGKAQGISAGMLAYSYMQMWNRSTGHCISFLEHNAAADTAVWKLTTANSLDDMREAKEEAISECQRAIEAIKNVNESLQSHLLVDLWKLEDETPLATAALRQVHELPQQRAAPPVQDEREPVHEGDDGDDDVPAAKALQPPELQNGEGSFRGLSQRDPRWEVDTSRLSTKATAAEMQQFAKMQQAALVPEVRKSLAECRQEILQMDAAEYRSLLQSVQGDQVSSPREWTFTVNALFMLRDL